MSTERYFYHSFPRRGGADSIDLGFAILESVFKHGLLLTPEQWDLNEELDNGSSSETYRICQKRICFTELHPSELRCHSESFGRFAIEIDISTLIHMGGTPVFYVPLAGSADSLGGISNSLLMRLGEVQRLLEKLEMINEVVDGCPHHTQLINKTVNGQVIGTTRCSTGAAYDLLECLLSDAQPIPVLLGAMKALFGLFYRTEDLDYTGQLGYYRQREWRILANMLHHNVRMTVDPSSETTKSLLDIDPAFFGKEAEFRSGICTIASQCQFFEKFQDEPVCNHFRRIIVPRDHIDRSTELLVKYDLSIPVVALEDL